MVYINSSDKREVRKLSNNYVLYNLGGNNSGISITSSMEKLSLEIPFTFMTL